MKINRNSCVPCVSSILYQAPIDCHMLATVRGSPGVFWNLRDLKLAEITTVGITSLSQK